MAKPSKPLLLKQFKLAVCVGPDFIRVTEKRGRRPPKITNLIPSGGDFILTWPSGTEKLFFAETKESKS